MCRVALSGRPPDRKRIIIGAYHRDPQVFICFQRGVRSGSVIFCACPSDTWATGSVVQVDIVVGYAFSV